MIDVCLCTHDPRRDVARAVLASLARQENPGPFRLLVVDNASRDPLGPGFLEPAVRAGIECRVVREERLGIAAARLRAIDETDAELVVFLDDDTELRKDYLANARAFAASRPDVGCFGGKLLLPPHLRPPGWASPFLPYLAIKDLGEATISECSPAWTPCEPPTAGAVVRREVLDRFRRRAADDDRVFRLGRVGRGQLTSGEDSLMMRGCHALGLSNAYVPSLVLYHHLNPSRFSMRYLIRLMGGYGRSHVTLERLLGTSAEVPPCYGSRKVFLRLLASEARRHRRQSLPFALGMVAYHLGARDEHLRGAGART